MMAAVRYLLSMLWFTVYHSVRVLWAAARGERREPGIYERIPREYVRDLLRANRIRVGVTGLEQLARLDRCVYAVNHQSWVDILAVVDVLPGRLRFLAKRELGRIPLFGRAMRLAGHITIDRQHHEAALEASQRAAAALGAGGSLVVFPEGTRSRDGRLHHFKKGPFVLAILAQVPVVPVFVEGSYAVLPPGSCRPRTGPVTVHVGRPIPTAGLAYDDRDALAEQAREAILAMGARA